MALTPASLASVEGVAELLMAIFDGCLTPALSQRERGPKPLRHESVKYMLTLYERELQYLLLLESHVLRHWEGVLGIGSFEVDERFRGLWIGSERCLGQKRSSHALQNWPW